MLKIIIYHQTYYLPQNDRTTIKNTKNINKETDQDRSIRRTKRSIEDIILSNNFDLWCTFTFNPKKIDRQNHIKCKLAMRTWLLNQRKRNSPDLKYLVVPELHKDGAIHFHALLKNYNGKLKDTGITTKTGQSIYNANTFTLGFTEFVKIDSNKDALAKYITKQYITKDMPLFLGKQRYYASQNLERPTSHVNGLSKFKLWNIVKNSDPDYINDSYELQYHQKVAKLDEDVNVSLLPSLF